MSELNLDAVEARALGVLLEKEVTTPDAYPLSVNAITAGCNQKSNRDPVMRLGETQVRDALERLVGRSLVREAGGAGGRVRRFAHRLDSRLFGTLEFSGEERAVLCLLLLRGPQTPGEIRSRSARLAAFPDLEAVEKVLDRLARREDGPFVSALDREPGRREVRYREHLSAGGEPAAPAPAQAPTPQREAPPGEGAVADLTRRVEELESRLQALEASLRRGGEPPESDASC